MRRVEKKGNEMKNVTTYFLPDTMTFRVSWLDDIWSTFRKNNLDLILKVMLSH